MSTITPAMNYLERCKELLEECCSSEVRDRTSGGVVFAIDFGQGELSTSSVQGTAGFWLRKCAAHGSFPGFNPHRRINPHLS